MPGRRGVLLIILVAALGTAGFGDERSGGTYRNVPRHLLERSVERRAAAVRLVRGGLLPASGIDRDGKRFSVQHIAGGMPQYYIELNDTARVTTRTDLIQLDGEYGAGMMLGIWDGGAVRTTHYEFGGRVTWADTALYEEADHATHVAGTMIASGVDTRALGMAPQAGLHSYDWDSDIAEVIGEASSGMLLSNHSYSLIRGWYSPFYIYWFGDTTVSGWEDYRFGFYCDESRVFDSLLCEYPDFLLVCSAGNERTDKHPIEGTDGHYIWNEAAGEWQHSQTPREEPDGGADGFDCISNGMNLAKNVLTVAAVRDVLAYTGPADVEMTVFSSWGPTDDGRIKPDISGNGRWVFSSIASADDDYGTGSGTSMASPNVCGSLALVQNRYKALKGAPMHAATLKALAIHTALEAGPDPGPDYMFGWGLLDAYGAFEVVEEDWFNNWLGRIEELELAQGTEIELSYRCDGTEDELRLTICWSDPPGTPALPALNPPDIMLVNDLDLRVSKDASVWMPWRLDPAVPAAAAATADNFRDNIEQIVIDSPTAGDYVVTISHKSTLTGGSQDVSLIATGGIRRRTWHIYADGSGDAPDITTAASLAGDYDSILVHPGTYHEHDINLNKWLYVIGVGGAETTFLDADGLGRCLYMPDWSDSVIVSGLTLTGGNIGGTHPHGGGIYCANSIARISGCIIEGNLAEDGGGIFLYEASPLIEDCVVTVNSASYRGGGIWGLSTSADIQHCLVANNSAASDGGGLYLMDTSAASVESCTFSHNEAGAYGSGIYLANGSGVTLTNTIVSFGYVTAGIHGHPYAAGVTMSCCDVYGNAGGDYGGSIPDQTGSNDNISVDPLYCDAAAEGFEIFEVSPCRAAASPCGTLIGWGAVGCAAVPDLVITEFTISDNDLVAGETTSATVTVKNVGLTASDPFMIDYYDDRSAAPSPGTTGTLRYSASGLAVGDSVIQLISPITSACYGEWRSWVRADTEDEVLELDEGNNVYGPRVIYWRIAQHAGWPVSSSDAVSGCPAIAALDDDPVTSEVIVGDAAGMLHVWREDGTYLPGWPVSVGDSLVSSPAVGNITGDYHAEVVIGATDGTLYAFDRAGTQLWSRNIIAPVYQTPALADLDDDGLLEVIIAVHGYKTGGTVHVLDGTTGMPWSGSWPVTLTAPRLSSPAVGDVDDDGEFEIAVCGYGLNSPVRSHIYLLRENGASFGGAWPVTIDTVIVAAPVLGDIAAAPGGPLEIVAGGINGEIFAVSTTGVVWPSPPRVPGTIERSLSLMQYDIDEYQEIICASSYYSEPVPPFGRWNGAVTVVDNTGSIMAGWPNGAGSSASRRVMPSASAITGTIFAGSPYGGGSLYAWSTKNAGYMEGFPNPAASWITSGTAVGDVDGDGQRDIVAATSDDMVNCFDVSCSGAYPASRRLDWPMFRCGATRTGCYYAPVITGDEEPETVIPAVTMIQSVHPNPFNPATRIVFDLHGRGRARVAVYNAAGRAVALLADRTFAAGRHELAWDGTTGEGAQVASGVYFCRLEAGGTVDVRKMVLLR